MNKIRHIGLNASLTTEALFKSIVGFDQLTIINCYEKIHNEKILTKEPN